MSYSRVKISGRKKVEQLSKKVTLEIAYVIDKHYLCT
jgi:hypothetical protein